MKILGITGGVGAGKSTVLEYLERKYQARVVQCDQAGLLLQEPGEICYQEIFRTFGGEILQKDGRLDRTKLAELVFSDKKKLAQLNSIVHPAVKKYILDQIEQEQHDGKRKLFVIEAALLLEDHYDQICDEIWYLHTDASVRRERLKKSRGYSEEKVTQIMQNQKTDTEFQNSCQFMVDNSSDIVENTYEQIDRGLSEHGLL
ncbi:MAG: dephospho-CoA kinase [Lachnospiraceae bacterium]|nr:dephospho-CoA kinase [Lachnospiraceae bacterium]